jgi:TIR domain
VQENWDIFMSHASPDKPYVRGLVKALREKGITVWFDDDCIAWGEPVRQAVKKGLNNSRYGIVVLSKAYLADRKWTEHEFDGLFARERINSFIILPIWHGVDRDEIEQYDAALADRRGSISNTDDYGTIVESVLKLLGRVSDEGAAQSAHTPSTPTARKYGPDERELIAYVWYYTPDSKGAQMYVRKVHDRDDLFTLEEPNGPVHEGTREEIADKYSSIDRRLLRSGLKHHVRNSSGAYSDFNLGN